MIARLSFHSVTFLAALAVLALNLTHAGAGEPDLAAILRARGIQPLTPAQPALAFELAGLDGTKVALADFAGRWVLLTFWATWCGPCRSEMPSLQQFATKHTAEGFTVLAVATGSDVGQVRSFVSKLGLSFPVVLDEEDRVAALYRAHSIPMTYLVDPGGRLVGLARGARDWSHLDELVAELRVASPPSESAEGYAAQSTPQAPVELPASLAPPTAEAELLGSGVAEPGEPFEVKIRIHWAGTFEDYLLHAPEITLPAGVRLLGLSGATSSQTAAPVVTYTARLAADAPGDFTIDPIELRYTPQGESEPISSRLSGPAVKISAPTYLGMTRSQAFAAGGGGLLSLGVAGLGLRLARRRRHAERERREVAPDSSLDGILDQARAHRIAGDVVSCLELVCTLRRRLGLDIADAAEQRELDAFMERARYGGQPPTFQEVDRLLRQMEREVRTRQPHLDPEDGPGGSLVARTTAGG
ncbi:MAG: TlpA family protein disulfide reductase [Candidatus Schekmanbacteria bacterium]|nr:TlpA family protein disulfide reductase [Candidatus Schekmanbacteria bacterium]